MKTCFWLLFLLPTFSLFAQGEKSPWSLEFHYTPQYFGYYSPEGRTSILVEDTYRAAYSYRLGAAANYQLSEKTVLSVGLAFQNSSEKTDWLDLRWGNEHDGEGGWAGPDPNNPNWGRLNIYYYFLQTPISLKHYFNSGKFRFYLRPGLQSDWAIGRRTAVNKDFGEEGVLTTHELEAEKKLRPFNVSLSLGVGMAMVFRKRVSFFAEPEFRTSLLTITENNQLKTRFYNLGWKMGVQLNFAESTK